MGTEVMGCLMDVELANSMPVVVVLTMYSMADRPASTDGFHDTCETCLGRTRTLNDPMHRTEDEETQLIYTKFIRYCINIRLWWSNVEVI